MKKIVGIMMTGILLNACIGVDELDDEKIGERVVVNSTETSVLITETLQLSGAYFNEFGIMQDVSLQWTSSDPEVLTVNSNGLVSPVNAGQALVTASKGSTVSEGVLLTVVGNLNDVAEVVINTSGQSISSVGETLQLSFEAKNVGGMLLTDKVATWSSSNTAVATISDMGLLTAVSNGETIITATVEGIASASFTVTVGSTSRTANFNGAGGYTAEGMATLDTNTATGDLVLTFSDDFRTSFALGTFIYLSNSTSGASTRANGVDLGEITANGAHTFNVTAASSGVSINDYRYVIVLCKPASITFGIADFEN